MGAQRKLVCASWFSMEVADTHTHTHSGEWSEEKQAVFSNYMGQTISAWGNVTEQGLANLFNGHDDTINTLTSLISDGKFIEGSVNGAPAYPPVTEPAESDGHSPASEYHARFLRLLHSRHLDRLGHVPCCHRLRLRLWHH